MKQNITQMNWTDDKLQVGYKDKTMNHGNATIEVRFSITKIHKAQFGEGYIKHSIYLIMLYCFYT